MVGRRKVAIARPVARFLLQTSPRRKVRGKVVARFRRKVRCKVLSQGYVGAVKTVFRSDVLLMHIYIYASAQPAISGSFLAMLAHA